MLYKHVTNLLPSDWKSTVLLINLQGTDLLKKLIAYKIAKVSLSTQENWLFHQKIPSNG